MDPDRRLSVRGLAARAAALTLGAAIALAVLGAPAASAHGEANQAIRTVIEAISPELEGVEARTVVSTSTALEVTNEGSEPLEVLSDSGEPFLRIGPDVVEANVSSRDWYASGNPDGAVKAPEDVELDGPPRWEVVSEGPTWRWFEHRLHPAAPNLPPEVVEGERTVKLADWTVPLSYGGEPAEITGRVDYRPVTGQIVPRLVAPPPAASGVTLDVLPGPVPGLFLESSADEPVTVIGEAGEPFARISARGVEVNERSATWRMDQQLRGKTVMPAAVDSGASPRSAPRWKQVSDSPRFSWLESRATYENEQPPDEVVERGTPTVLVDWTVPLEVGGEPVEARGETSWVPSEPLPGTAARDGGASTVGVVALALGALGMVVVTLLLVTRVRRRSAAP